MDVYLMEGEALIYIREYGNKNARLDVIYQTRFCGNLITLFSQGGIFLSVEGEDYNLLPLPARFSQVKTSEEKIAGYPVLSIYGGNTLLIISEHGRRIFMNEIENAQFGSVLEITAAFETCTAAKAECVYAYDGEKLTLVKSKTVETRPPEDNILHFAFFESVLICGDYKNYLSEDLKERANILKEYLGGFIGVTVPTESFYARHGEIKAAGLVFPKAVNLFEVKYYAVDMTEGKITNIYPAE